MSALDTAGSGAAPVNVRPAVAADIGPIAAFTKDTFVWGDYVADRLPTWLEEGSGAVYVATDDTDIAIAMARGQLLSPTEAWFGAARVHPGHRGRGIAGDLGRALMEWARGEGARIGRLIIEDWNEPSIRHVAKIGMRRVASFSRCHRAIGDASPVPGGNGGRRVGANLRARPARSAEAEPAFASWSVGDLGRTARGLFGTHWAFRRITVPDLEIAARDNAFWEIGGGWAMGRRDGESFDVGWIETRSDDAADVVRAIVDLAVGSGAEQLSMWLPTVDWLVRAARAAGCDADPMGIYAIEL